MSVIALASSPLSIAADDPETSLQVKLITKGQSYEIVDENGEKRAYRILKGGDREEVGLKEKSDGSYQLSYEDGQTVDLPNIDMDRIAGLKGLAGLEGLEALEALEALEGLEGLEGLEDLSALEGFEGLAALEGLEGLDGLDGLKVLRSLKSVETLEGPEKLEKLKRSGMVDGDVRVVTMHGGGFSLSSDSKGFENFPENFRKKLAGKGTKNFRIIRDGDSVRLANRDGDEGEVFELADTVVGTRFEFSTSIDPLENAQRQLERTKRQLETLSENENLSFDLGNALRDIQSAQKSLEAAENRLLDDND